MSGIDIAALRRMVLAIESNAQQRNFIDDNGLNSSETAHRFTLGHELADAAFPYGLAGNALHEVVAENPGTHMAATGFALGLAWRSAKAERPFIWIEEEQAADEYGRLYPPGLHAFGLDPARFLFVRCPGAQDVLKAANDALEANHGGKGAHTVSSIVIALSGRPKCLDLTASRRLLLAAGTAQTPIILLRSHRSSMQSAAVSRWRIAPAPSYSSGAGAPGKPAFNAVLERNRHGMCGQWIMEWNNEELSFGISERKRETSIPRTVVPLSTHGPLTPRRSA